MPLNQAVVCVAGPGSGKTSVLAHRIAYLLNEYRVAPESIVALTFTKLAAEEMKDHIETILSPSKVPAGIVVSTFHAFCLDVLKTVGEPYLGGGLPYRDKDGRPDFDMLLACVHYILSFKDAQLILQQKFRHILVDEFQDTNVMQYEILKLLCPPERFASSNMPISLLIVGDPNQAIYSWRGALTSNMTTFTNDYSRWVVARGMPHNYRSTDNICRVANAVLGKEGTRAVNASNNDTPAVEIVECSNDETQAETVASIIQQHIASSTSSNRKSSIAVLYRYQDDALELKSELRRQGIAFEELNKFEGGRSEVKLSDRKEVQDVICFLKVLTNPSDGESLKRAFTVFNASVKANSEATRGTGNTTFKAFIAWADAVLASDSLEPDLRSQGYLGLLYSLLDDDNKVSQYTIVLTEKDIKKMLPFAAYLQSLSHGCNVKHVAELGRDIVKHVVNETYLNTHTPSKADGTKQMVNRHVNVDLLLSTMNRFDSADVTGFLNEGILMFEDEQNKRITVHLMTFHNSKGREYDRVIITGAEERRNLKPDEVEEERKLSYVAITRAKIKLFVLFRKKLKFCGSKSMEISTELARSFQEASGLYTRRDSGYYLNLRCNCFH